MARCCFHPTIVSFGFSIIVVLCFVEMVSGQIETYTPPPRTSDNKPIESNGIIYYLDYIPKRCQNPYVRTFPFGGIVDRPVALVKRQSPHRIGKSIEISPKGCLFIEPGCKLEFAPGEGIIVNGTLIARVIFLKIVLMKKVCLYCLIPLFLNNFVFNLFIYLIFFLAVHFHIVKNI